MLHTETLYTLDDICIIPAATSNVRHRAECSPYVEGENLPIFTAPMDSVLDENNWEEFQKQGITPIIPRTVDIDTRMRLAIHKQLWIAVGLNEFEKYFTCDSEYNLSTVPQVKVLIDVANGNMTYIVRLIREAKYYSKKLGVEFLIMAGNVANPYTYQFLAHEGVWGVRVSVGSGACCITASNTGVHYPMASLINDCATLKRLNSLTTHIIADGGISNYARAIKALALGADYVMMGTAFVKAEESAAPSLIDISGKRIKKVYGMSTKEAQKKINPNAKLHTSEGIHKNVEVEYTLAQWVENFKDYIRSTMSYCNVRTLSELHDVDCGIMSPTAQAVINK